MKNQTKDGEPKTATKRKRKKMTNNERIIEIANQAAKMGMSYGKYVAKFGDEIEMEE